MRITLLTFPPCTGSAARFLKCAATSGGNVIDTRGNVLLMMGFGFFTIRWCDSIMPCHTLSTFNIAHSVGHDMIEPMDRFKRVKIHITLPRRLWRVARRLARARGARNLGRYISNLVEQDRERGANSGSHSVH